MPIVNKAAINEIWQALQKMQKLLSSRKGCLKIGGTKPLEKEPLTLEKALLWKRHQVNKPVQLSACSAPNTGALQDICGKGRK